MRSRPFCFFTLALATAPALRAQPMPAPGPNDRPPAHSVTVPFAVPVDFNHLDTTLQLLTAVNGGSAHAFTIDTGSVGVILPAIEVLGFDPNAPGNTPGKLRYSSSGLTLDGFWTTATVRFLNPDTQQPMAEATVQVLAVTKSFCQGGGANAGRCTGAIPHMLGVGFGRGGDAANGMQTQANNPFVNLVAMNSLQPLPEARMRHGYLITHAGITFGITGPETRGFQFVQLTPATTGAKLHAGTSSGAPPVAALSPRVGSNSTLDTTASSQPNSSKLKTSKLTAGSEPAPAPMNPASTFSRDYNTAPGFLTLGTHDFPMGTILIDTGLTNMIVEEPNAPSSGELEAGQPVTIHLLGNQLRYRFTTGEQTVTVAPRRASWAAYTHGPFVNTGLRALACFDYLYDADNGYLGLRPTCSSSE